MFAEWRYLRTGDELYRVLARRWSKVMLALFAVGVVTGTILSFEMGLLWPNFMATSATCSASASRSRASRSSSRRSSSAIYVYGWNRLSPRAHLLCGHPDRLAGFSGSLMVIAVNGWMNHPTGFTLTDGRAVDVHPFAALFENRFFWHELVHMYFAGYIVAGFLIGGRVRVGAAARADGRYKRTALVDPARRRRARRAAADRRRRLGGARRRRDAAGEARRPGRARHDDDRARPSTCSAGTTGTRSVRDRDPDLLSLLAFHDPNATVKGLDTVPPADRPPVNVVRFAFQTMVGIGSLLALLGVVYSRTWFRRGRLPASRWFYRAVVAAGPLSLVALIAGWITTEVGRQPWIVYRVMRTSQAVTGAGGIPVGYATLVARLRRARGRRRRGCCAGSRAPRSPEPLADLGGVRDALH